MKVTKNTPERFELLFAPWIMGTLLGAGILLFCGIILASFLAEERYEAHMTIVVTLLFFVIAFVCFVRRDELVLDRAAGTMEIRHSTFFGRSNEVFEIDDFEQASTQSQYQEKGHRGHRVALIMAGKHPKDIHNITPVYSGGPSAKDAADAINAWHKSS